MLKQILDYKKALVAQNKIERPQKLMAQAIRPRQRRLRPALEKQGWSLIAECKLASPAKGTLCRSHTVTELAEIFSLNGAAALSVHTGIHFAGELGDIAKVRQVSELPILRKDFIIDEYQLYESHWAGADAVLLIAAILTDAQLKEYLDIAGSLGLDSIVEVHDKNELLRAQAAKAGIIGINNRNLKTFATDVNNTFDLLPYCGSGALIISESGIGNEEQALALKKAGVDGILVGEGLVKAPDIGDLTRRLAWPGRDNEPKSLMN